jgi:YVTN family beta-propeller protein
MGHHVRTLPALLLGAAISTETACVVGEDPIPAESRSLAPVDDRREEGYVPRSRPEHVELSADGSVLFVALAGNLVDPKSQVLALDAASGSELARIDVGRAPKGMALSADGSLLYVANQLSDFMSIIDTGSHEVVGTIAVSFYAQDIALAPDGARLLVSNRWLDAVELVTLAPDGRSGRVSGNVEVGANPRDLVVAGDYLYVGNLGGNSISLIDLGQTTGEMAEIDRHFTNAPVNGLATDGERVFVATLGMGDGHPESSGVEAGVTYRGDGTANRGFGDINNDVAVLTGGSDGITMQHRYTSDTAEVSAADVAGSIDPDTMRVAGALPEQMVVRGSRLFVTMSASDSVQVFAIDGATGALTSEAVLDTGINPFEIAVNADGTTVYTADRLGETVSMIDVAQNRRQSWRVDPGAEPYPANDYERGELLFHSASTSSEALPSAVFPEGDKAGDKSCNHCHREGMSDGKVWMVGVGLVVRLGGQRMAPSARNLEDTEPLFWEGTQTHEDFDLEVNEFAPPADFGCDPALTEEDPASCAAREAFFTAQTGFTFEQVGRELIGEFLLGRSRLMPNPDAQAPSPAMAASIERGARLFSSAEVGCSRCHSVGAFTNNENVGPVITPSGLDNGLQFKDEIDGNFNVPSLRGVWDRPGTFFHDGRAKSIRATIATPGDATLEVGSDGCHMLDQETARPDGVVAPIYNGSGCNELMGEPDSHGATSHLSAEQLDDLLNYVLSIE